MASLAGIFGIFQQEILIFVGLVIDGMSARKYATRVLSFVSGSSDFSMHAIIGMDYDLLNSNALEKDVRSLQRKYDLGDFYIFQNPLNKHLSAVCFSIVDYPTLKDIILASEVDPLQKKALMLFNCVGFRISEKEHQDMYKPYHVIERASQKRQYSSAYYDFFKKIYGDSIKDYPKEAMFGDGVVIIERYPLREINVSEGITPQGVLNEQPDQ